MAEQAGDQGIVRRHLTLPAGDTTVDTLLATSSQAYAPDPGIQDPPSRVMVCPMAPVANWANITHGEPYVAVDGSISVDFTNAGAEVDINVFFFLPHTIIGPVQADTYEGGEIPP